MDRVGRKSACVAELVENSPESNHGHPATRLRRVDHVSSFEDAVDGFRRDRLIIEVGSNLYLGR